MEIDWAKRYLNDYVSEGNQVLHRLESNRVRTSFLDHALRLLLRYLEIPRQASTLNLDQTMVQMAHTLYEHIMNLGYWDQVSLSWTKITIIVRQLPDPELNAQIIKQLAIVKNNQGFGGEALALYQHLVASADFEQVSTFNQAETLHQLGLCQLRQGNYTTAKIYLGRSLAIAGENGHWEIKAYALNQLGNLAMLHGDFKRAWQHYQDCLTTFEDNGEENNLACVAYQSLGRLHLYQREFEEAIPVLQRGLKIRKQRQEQEGTATNAIYLATAYIECERLDEAGELLNGALQTSKILNDRRTEAHCYRIFGCLEIKQGNHEAAIVQWQQALNILSNLSVPGDELQILALLIPHLLRAGRIRNLFPLLIRLFGNVRQQRLSLSTILRFIVKYIGRA